MKINANGITHHVRTAGDAGRAMVFLHGWPQTSYCWRHAMRAFAPDYRTLAPDLRGFAESDKPDGPYDKRTVAGDIVAIMDESGIDDAVLVGHDIGARVAVRLAIDAPERVQALVIIAGRYPALKSNQVTDPQQAIERWYFFFHQYPDLAESLTAQNIDTYIGHFLHHWSHPSFDFGDEDLAEYVRGFSQPKAMRGGFEHYRAAMNEDVAQWEEDVGKTIDIPTLVVWGEDDPVSPPYYSDGYHRVFPQLRFHFVSQCGHFPHEEHPVETIDAIKSFLATVRLR